MKTFLAAALTLFTAPAVAQTLAADVPPGADVPVASVAAVNGEVILAQRAQLAPAEAGAALLPGDRLMTLDGADALIAFADGCRQRLESNGLLVIGETDGCSQGIAPVRSFRQAIGDPGGAATEPGMSPGQKTAVTAAVLVPLLWLWDHNRDDEGREPVSR